MSMGSSRTVKQFKVAAISSNTNAFGHHGHILISKDGMALEGARFRIGTGNPLLKVGDVLEFEVNDRGYPLNWYSHLFETIHDFRDGKAPPKVVKEVWG